MASTTRITCPSPPFVTVEGVPNFRDLGGKDCNVQGNNGTVQPGYIYRCAQPTHITDPGRETLASTLEIHDIFDLRSFKELRLMSKRYPDAPLETPGIERHHVPIFLDEDYTPISLAKKYDLDGKSNEAKNTSSDQTGEKYIDAYKDILTQAARTGAFRTILDHILHHPDRPLAFHCTAGKDRTGVLAALILQLCGVSDEDIVQDYAWTTYGLGSWREHLIRRLMEGAGREYGDDGTGMGEEKLPTREQAERIVSSRPEQMKGFLRMIVEDFGGARGYLKEGCAFEDGELDQIVTNLTSERN